MERKNEKTKFYVAMDGRWAQLSESDENIGDLLKKVSGVRPMLGKNRTHIIHIN